MILLHDTVQNSSRKDMYLQVYTTNIRLRRPDYAE